MLKRSNKPVLSAPKLAVSCAAIRRCHSQKDYSPHNYEVCLLREGYEGLLMFPGGRVAADQEPQKTSIKFLRRQTGLKGSQAFPVHVHGRPAEAQHVITMFYIIPVGFDNEPTGFPSMETKFHNLAYVLQNEEAQYDMVYGQHEMLHHVDQWLKERHLIPFVNMDLLFLGREKEGIGGQILAFIENPIFGAEKRPAEDDLLLALNNPMFESVDKTHSTLTA